jgi:hypothetical protein
MYLYGKSIQNCRWELVAEIESQEDIDKILDEKENDYLSFQLSEVEISP